MSPKSLENTERINVFFSPAVLDRLKQEAAERGMTVSGLVRMIVMEWLKGKAK
jgi:predicted DNA binding CopG/RHH family protein